MPIIIEGGSYSAGGWWSKHLQRTDTNDRVTIIEYGNLTADNIPDAFREMEAFAVGTKCTNYFYQANINPRADEHLTPEQWEEAVDRLEKNLGLTGQPRFVVEHEKEGRTHRHVVWSRIDTELMKAIPDSLTAVIHERTSRELEVIFDLERGKSCLVPDREFERPERHPKHEKFREERSSIDPETVRVDAREAKQSADNALSFKAALEADGDYLLARGDRRDFVIIDPAGDVHSLPRALGMKTAAVREFMEGLDRDSLPSVQEAAALQRERNAERKQQFEQELAQSAPAAHGPYSELRHAPAEGFEPAARNTTTPQPASFDRDAADAAWLDAVTNAAIAKEAEKDLKGGETRGGDAHGTDPSAQLPAAADLPKPERELKGAAADIRLAWQTSQTVSELEDALSVRGISLAEVSQEEAHETHRRAVFAKEFGNFADQWREGEIVAVDGRGRVYHLNERTTGDDAPTISGKLAGIDRAALMNVADTQEVMREAAEVEYLSERRAEREEARRPNFAEQVIDEALRSTKTGTEFAEALDKRGIIIGRMTAHDEQTFAEIQRQDIEAGTLGTEASGLRIPDVLPGELAAVTSQGNMLRLSPQKLDLEEVVQRLADVQSGMPSLVEARAAAEIKQEEKEERQAAFIAERIEAAELFAGRQELRQAARGAENTVHAAFEAPEAIAEETVRPTLKIAGIASRIFATVYDFAFGWATAEPKLTAQQVHDEARAAGNTETLHARAVAEEMQAKEAAHDWAMHAQKTAQQEQDLSFAERYGTPPTREANLGRELDQGRERERERD